MVVEKERERRVNRFRASQSAAPSHKLGLQAAWLQREKENSLPEGIFQ